jgi:Beta-galactosidase
MTFRYGSALALLILSQCGGSWIGRAQDTNQLRPWLEYRTIMWIGDSAYKDPARLPVFFERLREMGINTAMVYHDGDLRPLLDSRFPYYVENMINRGLCLKFNSKVTDWDGFVTSWARTRDEAPLVRDYTLDDPRWRQWARDEIGRLVRKNRDHQPLAYDIRDELSVTISANPFDYDFSPAALEGFRQWLRSQYRDLALLNEEWQTTFNSWADVRPFTTDQIKARMASNIARPAGKPDWAELQQLTFDPGTARQTATRWNFAPWADFRGYMDLSLARALDDLRQSAHALDPQTPVGIEGTQMPAAFGGYDLWRLSQALDWVEPYDIGNAREIFGSFMPGKPILTTVGESDPQAAARRLWHLLLLGDRGCLVWWSEDSIAWNTPGYDLTPKAQALRPVLKEMTSPLAQLFLRASIETDPIDIHYSQTSIQADWLLESTRDGSTWLRRFSSFEADYNRMAKVRNSWLKALQDLGYTPRFVSSEQIEQGELLKTDCQALVLPSSLALSDKEIERIMAFLKAGPARTLLCDGIPGLFDQHGKLRQKGPPAMFASAPAHGISCFGAGGLVQERSGDIAGYGAERLGKNPSLDWPRWIKANLKSLPLASSVPLNSLSRVHRYRLGAARLIAVERNINYQMSEDLKQAGGNQNLEKTMPLELSLVKPVHVYDLRRGTYLGHTDRILFQLDPWRPSLFALLEEKIPDGGLVESLLRTMK